MRRNALALVFLLVISPAYAQLSVDDIHFSPKGGCTAAIVKELDAAKSTIRVQAYELTSKPIAGALVKASKRNVKVEVILDRSQQNQPGGQANALRAIPAISVKIDGNRQGLAHDKIIIIDPDLDSAVVITGSFNFTKRAEEKNGENLLVIRDRKIAAKYLTHWNNRNAAAAPAAAPAPVAAPANPGPDR